MGMLKAGKFIEAYKQIEIGLDKSKIIELLGQPNGVRNISDIETMSWQNAEFKGLLRGGTITRKIVVDFKDDKVVGYDSENMGISKW